MLSELSVISCERRKNVEVWFQAVDAARRSGAFVESDTPKSLLRCGDDGGCAVLFKTLVTKWTEAATIDNS